MAFEIPQEEKTVTNGMLEEKISRIQSLIQSGDRLLPKTIDVSLEECDGFINLISRYVDQKLQMARNCIYMSHYVEEIHAFVALALTPALTLTIFAFVSLWSGSFNQDSTTPNFPIYSMLPQVLRPFIISCIPFVVYLAAVFFWSRSLDSGDQPSRGPNDVDTFVSKMYPKLKSISEIFRKSEERQKYLYLAWAVTGVWGAYLIGINPAKVVPRVCGLLLLVTINFLIGLSLTIFPTFAKALYPFYTPLEKMIRIISFSPILLTILTAFGALLSPPVTKHVDYPHLRDQGLELITTTHKKFNDVSRIQKVIGNIREYLKLPTQFQNLAQGIPVVKEIPTVASNFINLATDYLKPLPNTSGLGTQTGGESAPEVRQLRRDKAPRREKRESGANLIEDTFFNMVDDNIPLLSGLFGNPSRERRQQRRSRASRQQVNDIMELD